MSEREFYEEKLSNGSILRSPGTRWRNDTAQHVTMELFLEGPIVNPMHRKHLPTDARSNPQLFPARWLNVTVKPGEEIVLPSFLDCGVQAVECTHPACRLRPLECVDVGESHTKRIVGGLGPQLTRVSPQISPEPPRLSRALDPGMPAVAPQSLDDRLAERARRGVQ